MSTLQDQFVIYRDACYPPASGKLSEVQEAETHQAFFAGALTTLDLITKASEKMPEDEAAKFLSTLATEIMDATAKRIIKLKRN